MDCWMKNMPRRSTEIATMQISENLGGANEMGPEITVSSIYCLRPFEEEETGARAMICLNKSHSYTVGVRD
jgi:hypothetical protein